MISKIANVFLACLMMLATGCMNLWVRCPGTSAKIETTYQCTQETFVWSYVIMFPQVMAPGPHDSFVAENLITVPLGCLCFVDVACEAVIDTIFWPADKAISSSRARD